jgi:hypothetical protein
VVAAGIWLGALGNGMGIVSVCGACVLMLLKIRSVSTRVTEVGVSQLTLRGRVHLSWHEVTQVTRGPLSLTLVGTNRRVVVSLEEFADSAAVISYMESHIPSNLRSDLGADGSGAPVLAIVDHSPPQERHSTHATDSAHFPGGGPRPTRCFVSSHPPSSK